MEWNHIRLFIASSIIKKELISYKIYATKFGLYEWYKYYLIWIDSIDLHTFYIWTQNTIRKEQW